MGPIQIRSPKLLLNNDWLDLFLRSPSRSCPCGKRHRAQMFGAQLYAWQCPMPVRSLQGDNIPRPVDHMTVAWVCFLSQCWRWQCRHLDFGIIRPQAWPDTCDTSFYNLDEKPWRQIFSSDLFFQFHCLLLLQFPQASNGLPAYVYGRPANSR